MATSPSPSTPAASFPFPAGSTEAPDPTIPKLFRPFQWIENPNAEQIAAASDRFIEKFQLLPDAMSLQKFLAMDFHRLGSLVYPFADTTAATIGTDWLVWIFAWDDDCDRTSMGRDPEEMRQRFRQYLDIFHGRPAPADAPPLIVALENLVARMLARAGKEWLDGFIPLVADYFDGCLWEAENRHRGQAPSLADYLEWRLKASAVYTVFELFALTGKALPAEIRRSPAIAELSRVANNVICWANDLYSFKKEYARGDVHNLVILLMIANDLDADHAMVVAGKMHDREVARYLELESRLPSHGSELDAQIATYCRQLRVWMAGNYEWSDHTYRYQGPALEV